MSPSVWFSVNESIVPFAEGGEVAAVDVVIVVVSVVVAEEGVVALVGEGACSGIADDVAVVGGDDDVCGENREHGVEVENED